MLLQNDKLLFCPKENEKFYYYSLYRESVQEMFFTKNNERCLQNWALGNCFKTYQEAEYKGLEVAKDLKEKYKQSKEADKIKDKDTFWYFSLFSDASISTTFASFNERDLAHWYFKNAFSSEKEANITGKQNMEQLQILYEQAFIKDASQS